MNAVASEPYVNFTLYSKKCNCSQDVCEHNTYSADLSFLNVSDVAEVDADQ